MFPRCHPVAIDSAHRHGLGRAGGFFGVMAVVVCVFGLLAELVRVRAAGNELVGELRSPVTALALTPDSESVGKEMRRLVIAAPSGVAVVAGLGDGESERLAVDLAKVHDLRFSPDASRLLVAGGAPAEAGSVEIWDWARRSRSGIVTGHADVVYRVAWSPAGDRFVTAGGDGICQVVDAASGRVTVRYAGHSRPVLAIGFLDADTLVSAGVDHTVRLWKAADGTPIRTLDNHLDAVNDLAVRPVTARFEKPATASSVGLAMLATVGEDRTVRLWQPTIGRLVRFRRLPSAPRTVAWSGDGSRLYVGCTDGRVRVLDPDDLEVLSDQQLLAGRIHELRVDGSSGRVWVGGEGGMAEGVAEVTAVATSD